MDTVASPSFPNLLYWILGGLAALALLVVLYVLRKGRRLPGDHVFRASRLSKGNRLFPAQVVITPTSLSHFHPQWIGKLEESIHMAHVSSIKIDTNILFADVVIESTGGHNPIVCYGHTKRDAVEMKKTIERYQSEVLQETRWAVKLVLDYGWMG